MSVPDVSRRLDLPLLPHKLLPGYQLPQIPLLNQISMETDVVVVVVDLVVLLSSNIGCSKKARNLFSGRLNGVISHENHSV